jgi:hypothetical protein
MAIHYRMATSGKYEERSVSGSRPHSGSPTCDLPAFHSDSLRMTILLLDGDVGNHDNLFV